LDKQALNYLFGCFSVNGIGSRLSNISPLPVFFFFLDTVWQAGERVDEARPISTPIQELRRRRQGPERSGARQKPLRLSFSLALI